MARPQFIEGSPERKDPDLHSAFAQANSTIQPRIMNNELGSFSRQGSGDIFGNMVMPMPQQALFFGG